MNHHAHASPIHGDYKEDKKNVFYVAYVLDRGWARTSGLQRMLDEDTYVREGRTEVSGSSPGAMNPGASIVPVVLAFAGGSRKGGGCCVV